jgi:hypothetical protein
MIGPLTLLLNLPLGCLGGLCCGIPWSVIAMWIDSQLFLAY